jgi:RNA polymerase sigma factor (sigma-70 family)
MAILNHKPNRPEDAITKLTPMVHKMAHKFSRNHKSNDFNDLVQNGFVGVMEAYNRYDPSAKCAFSSYAYQWIFACMNDDRRKAYKNMNNTSAKTLDHVAESHSYQTPMDTQIDFTNRLERLSGLDRAIVRGRAEGYNFRELAEAATNIGHPMTLHQCRKRYIAAMGE